MIATTDLPATIEELHKLRNSVVADYIHAREMEQDREDDEDYTPGKSGRLMATLRAIDAKIATIPVEQPADTPVIDPNNPMTWPSMQSGLVTVELAYLMGRHAAVTAGGVHPDRIDAGGFRSRVNNEYRRGWEDAEREAQ